MRKITHIIVHHSGDRYSGKQLWKINEWHRSQGFPQSDTRYFVGYHYLIEHDGTLVPTRYEYEIGAHDQGENEYSIGVCLAGDFNQDIPTAEQVDTLGKLLVYLVQQHKIPPGNIVPHRVNDSTDCYGSRLPDNFAQVVYYSALPSLSAKVRIWFLSLLWRVLR